MELDRLLISLPKDLYNIVHSYFGDVIISDDSNTTHFLTQDEFCDDTNNAVDCHIINIVITNGFKFPIGLIGCSGNPTIFATTLSYMFNGSNFNGIISNWDVSSVEDMSYMFSDCNFNGNISNWDVSNVLNMSYMFSGSMFSGDISKWNISKVIDMSYMFNQNNFDDENYIWDKSNTLNIENMFDTEHCYDE